MVVRLFFRIFSVVTGPSVIKKGQLFSRFKGKKKHLYPSRVNKPNGNHRSVFPASARAEFNAFRMARGTEQLMHRGGSPVAKKVNNYALKLHGEKK